MVLWRLGQLSNPEKIAIIFKPFDKIVQAGVVERQTRKV